MESNGYLKLADFGLAASDIKSPQDFAKSFCGSPIYLSPEILKQRKTFKGSDYYAAGVVMFELVCGEPPFFSDDINSLYQNIKQGQIIFDSQIDIQLEAKDIIK